MTWRIYLNNSFYGLFENHSTEIERQEENMREKESERKKKETE